MKKYALACDLDGTLIKHNNGKDQPRSVLKEDIERVLKLIDHGHLYIVSTGRTMPLTFGLFDRINVVLKNSFYITSNGAQIYDANRKCIYSQNIPLEEIKKAFHVYKKFASEYNLGCEIFDGQTNYRLNANDDFPDVSMVISMCVDSIDSNIENAKVFYDHMKENMNEAAISMNNWYVDIIPLHLSKASAIKHILSLQDEKYELCAIGDSWNDTPMFEIADRSFAFSFSPKEVQDKATDVVDHLYQCIDILLED